VQLALGYRSLLEYGFSSRTCILPCDRNQAGMLRPDLKRRELLGPRLRGDDAEKY